MWLQRIKTLLRPELAGLFSAGNVRKLRTPAALFAGLATANLLVYLFVLAPASADLARQDRSYAELKKRQAEAQLFIKQRDAFAGLKAGIPTQKDMPILVKVLVQQARAMKLSVGAINYDIPRRGAEDLTMLAFTFPAGGSYPDVKRFIHHLETTDRFVGIQDLRIGAEKGAVRLELKLIAYIRGE